MFPSRFMPCAECGASLDRLSDGDHVCDPVRRVDFQMFALRDELATLEARLRSYLQTSAGRFEAWLAARQVRGDAG